jgi:hypothetical protein
MSEWISVKQELPPDDRYVLVWQNFFMPRVALARYWGERHGWCMGQVTGDVTENISHWTPMLAPPLSEDKPTEGSN